MKKEETYLVFEGEKLQEKRLPQKTKTKPGADRVCWISFIIFGIIVMAMSWLAGYFVEIYHRAEQPDRAQLRNDQAEIRRMVADSNAAMYDFKERSYAGE